MGKIDAAKKEGKKPAVKVKNHPKVLHFVVKIKSSVRKKKRLSIKDCLPFYMRK